MIHDLTYGLRMLVRSPAFTLVAALSLALGIGANTAIFSLVNAVLLRPIPVEQPSELASIFMTDQRNPGNLPFSHLNYQDVRDQNQVFTETAAFTFAQLNWSTGNDSEQIPAQVVSGNYFSLLGAQPAIGRGFMREEDVIPTPVTVLSHGFWQRSLGSDPGIVGKTLTFNRTPFTVIGVAPKGFTGTLLGGGPSIWVPMSMHAVAQPNFDWYEQRRGLFLFAFGRMKPGVTLEQAFPNDNKGRGAGAVPLLDARLNPGGQGGGQVVQISMILMTVVGIVLLIACVNIANLMLARANQRRKEIAIRLALGAGRGRLVRQLLTESVLLSVLGGALGLMLAYWLMDALLAADLQLPVPVDDSLTIDGRVLTFTALLALATGMLFGLAPAIQGSRPDVLPVLKNETAPSGTGRGWHRFVSLRQVLVVSQVALSLISLIAAGLFLRSFRDAQATDTGFETRGVLVMDFNLGREGYTPERGQLFYQQVVERVAGVAGVQLAAVAQNPPLAGGLLRSVLPEGADTTTQDRILVQVNSVSTGYLDTLGIPLLRGRDFASTDSPGAPLVVIVNETMAERFWPGQDALGKRFKFFGDADFTTVVGVARNAKYNGVAEEPIPFIYQPIRQNYTPQAALHVRAAGDAGGLAATVRRQVQEIDPTLSVFDIRTLETQVADSLAPLRINVIVLSTFGGLALLLASIGLYGVASYGVGQRTREIGVRMALGAQPSNVLRLVLGHGLLLVAIGLVAGVVLALGLSTIVPPDLLPNVGARDPWTFVATSALLATVAVIASYVPARRATRIDPLIALRTE
ncbi:MAG: ABC transporter permease [Acidobacteria bacterium]|nr:ABC transporter permease [Acidobacteriota bacterium]